jgi:urease accessory protein
MRILLSLCFLFLTSTAFAHTGAGSTSGFMHGFLHPLSGIDHMLAMVPVGVFAGHLGGRALWLVPCAFVSMMIVGDILGMTGAPVPLVEVGIGLSVVLLALAVAVQVHRPTLAAMAVVGFFAVVHGHAHGSEMPDTASGLFYGMGFTLATALLHLVGIGLGLSLFALKGDGRCVAQVGGGAISLVGVGMLAGLI